MDPQWDARTTAVLDRLTKVVENGREEAIDLKEDCEIANKQLEATAVELKRVKAKLERVEKEKESILCELNKIGGYDYYETCCLLMFNYWLLLTS
jgi:chromosome segregation ATPase